MNDKHGITIVISLILFFIIIFSIIYNAEQKYELLKKDINNWEQIIIINKTYEESFYVKKQMFNGRFYYEGDEYTPAKYIIEYYKDDIHNTYIERISNEEYNNICIGDTLYKFKY